MIASCVQNSLYRASMYFISNTSFHDYSWWGKGPIWLTKVWNWRQYWTFALCCQFAWPPSIELAFIYRWVLCKRFFAVSVYTVLLIFMPACWCKLDISIECLTVKVIFSVNSQFDTNIILQEAETKQGGTYV